MMDLDLVECSPHPQAMPVSELDLLLSISVQLCRLQLHIVFEVFENMPQPELSLEEPQTKPSA